MTNTEQADFGDIKDALFEGEAQEKRENYHAVLNSFNRRGYEVQNAPQIAEYTNLSREKVFSLLEELETAAVTTRFDLGNVYAWTLVGAVNPEPGGEHLRNAVNRIAFLNSDIEIKE